MKNNKLTLGGAALNSARASVHWLKRSGTKAKILYTGSIGEDSIGNKVFTETEKAGVEGFFGRTSKARTATVVSLTNGKERTLGAYIGAAKLYQKSTLKNQLDIVKRAEYLYTTGFFLDSSRETV